MKEKAMLFGAMNYPIRPLVEEIETFGELGFDYLELAMDPPEAHHLQLRAARDTIRKALEKYRMGLVCHLPTFLHTADLTPGIRRASREELQASIVVAAHLGARRAVLHPSCIGGMGRHVPALAADYARQSLDAAVEWAARAGIDLCLENLFPPLTPFGAMEDWDQVFERYPALGLTLDIGHAHIGPNGMAGVLTFIARFKSRLRHLHVSDNRGHRDDHLPIGDGLIDFAAVGEALHRVDYREGITLEIFSDDRRDLLRSRERLTAILTSFR
jgi:sugar phosphate isomerase/epimerase